MALAGSTCWWMTATTATPTTTRPPRATSSCDNRQPFASRSRKRGRFEPGCRWSAPSSGRSGSWAEAESGNRVGGVTTELELQAGERLVRVTTSFDNPSRDHRLRAWFPLPAPAATSRAECAFGIVERGREAEGGIHEYGLPTFPSRRFVSAGGLTVVHEGLLEYELVDDGRALAPTLLRATGMLSRDGMTYRPQPAGPAMAVEGPQMIGHLN